jgi:hypothetical protein
MVPGPAPAATQAQSLSVLIGRYEDAKALKKELEDQAKEQGGEIESLERDIVAAMNDLADAQGLEDASKLMFQVGDYRYGLNIKGYWSIPAELKPAAIERLRDLGHGDLIKEDIPDKGIGELLDALLAEAEAAAEENGEGVAELPEEYAALGAKRFDKTKITRNKVPAGKGR